MTSRRAFLLLAMPLIAAAQKIAIRKLTTRKYTLNRRDYLFLEMETDSGITGLGEGTISGRVDIVEQAIQTRQPVLRQ